MLELVDRRHQTTDVLARIMGRQFIVPGFEDVLLRAGFTETCVGAGGLIRGAGGLYNTHPSISQLATVIDAAKDPAARRIIDDESIPSGADVIRELRERRVLAGMRVLDLGCGMRPGFALATQALGADMFTVDGRPLPRPVSDLLGNHTVLDLNEPGASVAVRDATGGNLDCVSECIIAEVPEAAHLRHPGLPAITCIANINLISGGVLYMHPDRWYQKA